MPCLGPASQGSAWPLRWVEGQCGGQLRAVPPLLSLSGAHACGMLHGAGTLSCMWVNTFGLTCSAVVSACSVWSHANQPDRCRQSLCYAGHVLYRDMTCHPVCQSVCEPSARPTVRGGVIVGTLPLQRASQRMPWRPAPLHPAAAHHRRWIGCQSLGRGPFNGVMLWIC